MPVECELLDRLDSVMDMLTEKYLFIDKKIFATKLVEEGIDSAVEFVSLLFSNSLTDGRFEKFGTSITKDITDDVEGMVNDMKRYNLTELQAKEYMEQANSPL